MLECAYIHIIWGAKMDEIVSYFKALSDKTRLRIMWLLSKANSELCVCEIMDSLNESQYNVSRHLKVLKNTGLVKERKEGRWVSYSLANPVNISRFQELVLETLSSLPKEFFSSESERLKKRLSLRENGKCVVGINSEEWRKILNRLEQKGGEQHVQKAE